MCPPMAVISMVMVGVNAIAVSLQLSYIGLLVEYNTAVTEKQADEEDIALAIAHRALESKRGSTQDVRYC